MKKTNIIQNIENYAEPKFIRIKQLVTRLGVSKSSIWAWCKEGLFPEPIQMSKKITAWKIEKVELWEHELDNQCKKDQK